MRDAAAALGWAARPAQPVPVDFWPRRLRSGRPAVTALSRTFLQEMERLLCNPADVPTDSVAAGQARPLAAADLVKVSPRWGLACFPTGKRA